MPRPLFARGRQGSEGSSDNAYEQGSDTGSMGYSGYNQTEGIRSASPAMSMQSSLSAAAADFSSSASAGPPAPAAGPAPGDGPRLFRYIGGPPQQQQQQPPPLPQTQPLPPPPHLQQQQRQAPPPGNLPLGQLLPPPLRQTSHHQLLPLGQNYQPRMDAGLGAESYDESGGTSLAEGIIGVSAAMDPLEAVLGPFPCARLRGLPFEASLEDVLSFFTGLVVLDVVVLNPQGHAKGQGQGEAFVVFANPMDFQMALQRDQQRIGRASIDVFQGKRHDYYAAIAAQHMAGNGPGGYTRDGGAGMPLMGGGDVSPSFPGQYGGSSLQQAAGMSGMAGMPGMGMPPMDNFGLGGGMGGPGNVNDMNLHSGIHGVQGVHGVMPPQGVRQSQNRPTSRGGGIREGEHTGFLRMRGLPFSATRQEILEFFEEFDPLDDSICLTCRSDGRATGEAYVAFNSPEDAKKAMGLHRSTMGSRYIELFISNKDEHARAMARTNNKT